MVKTKEELIEIREAYYKMRRQEDAVANYPIELLIEWDNVRMKLNPHARLSPAQIELQQNGEA